MRFKTKDNKNIDFFFEKCYNCKISIKMYKNKLNLVLFQILLQKMKYNGFSSYVFCHAKLYLETEVSTIYFLTKLIYK